MPDVLVVLLDLAIVIAVARGGGWLADRCDQPRITGEMLSVILVGPTVLGGQIGGVIAGVEAGGGVNAVFPPVAVDVLTAVGAVGMVLYMLLVGVQVDVGPLSQRLGTILVLAFAIVASMGLLALVAATWLTSGDAWHGPSGTSLAFGLALAAALAAHGVPIAARILEHHGLEHGEVAGVVIATGAAVTTLALVVCGAAIRGGDPAALTEMAVIVAGAALLVAVAAPLARSRWMRLGPRIAVIVLLAITFAAGFGGRPLLGTVLVGPLIVGIAVRCEGFSAELLEARLGTLVRNWLLPVFLGAAALHADLRELVDGGALLPALLVLVAVIAVKRAVVYASARALRFERVHALAICALLQCGGVMTIAISLEALQAEIITARTHAMLTLAGLVTTVVAGPLLARSGLVEARRVTTVDAPLT